jgi:hypothetical protein
VEDFHGVLQSVLRDKGIDPSGRVRPRSTTRVVGDLTDPLHEGSAERLHRNSLERGRKSGTGSNLPVTLNKGQEEDHARER